MLLVIEEVGLPHQVHIVSIVNKFSAEVTGRDDLLNRRIPGCIDTPINFEPAIHCAAEIKRVLAFCGFDKEIHPI